MAVDRTAPWSGRQTPSMRGQDAHATAGETPALQRLRNQTNVSFDSLNDRLHVEELAKLDRKQERALADAAFSGDYIPGGLVAPVSSGNCRALSADRWG